jgi:predicted ribosome quality control (RQC) complex YloA/Tae2 family protein
MPLDAICLQALTAGRAPQLEGAKIEKVQQPERDLLLLSVRGKMGGGKLLISAGTGNARVHFTTESMENPTEPPMFCMLLRKHLVGARILSVAQPDHERMLRIDLEARDEMGDVAGKALIVEMIGRSSNVILVGPDGRIIDCLRRMDFAGDELRRLLPGMIYRMPPAQDKRSVFELNGEAASALIASADRSIPVDRWLLNHFSGLSPLICRELAFQCGENYDALAPVLSTLIERINTQEFFPTMLLEDGEPRDFSFMEIKQYGAHMENCCCESFSGMLDSFYAQRERAERQRRRSHDLLRTVRTARDRIQRKLSLQREEFRRTESRDEVRKQAELLTANLYRLKKGDCELLCEDYYQEDLPEVRIPLDPLKTPQQNAAAMYREYNKLKAAAEHLRVFLAQGEQQLDYLESVLDQIERAEGEKDLAELRKELTETGYLKRQKKGKPEKVRAQGPLLYRSDDGFEILVGRNNMQNDELTTKTARRTDYWLHTQKVHGSHVIIRCEGEKPPERTIEQAASLAVYHSQGRDGGKIPVDVTMIRFVRKPSGALPGKVVYTDLQTLLSQADETLANRLRQKK